MTSSIASTGIDVSANAPLIAAAPSSAAVTDFNAPPKLPIGVRFAATINTLAMLFRVLTL